MRARIAELERDWLQQQVDRQTETAAELLARLGRLSDQVAMLQLAPSATAHTGVDAAGANVSTTVLSKNLRALRADLARSAGRGGGTSWGDRLRAYNLIPPHG